MYGCTADPKMTSMSNFVEERLFPWMMSQKAPDKFSFSGCKFRVRKCKESTARVVMWRQMGITNSFTMEATFCGANFGDMAKGRHFHVGDFEGMGRDFCEVLLEYSEAKNGNRSEMTQAFVELACKMTRDILRQTLGNYHLDLSKEDSVNINKDETSETNKGKRRDDSPRENEENECKTSDSGVKKFPLSKSKPVNFVDVRVQGAVTGEDDGVEFSVKSVHVDSFNDCLKILENLNLVECFDESDSSDSDSDPDETDEKEDEPEASGGTVERKKKKKKKKKAKHWWDTLSKPLVPSETSNSTTTDEECSNKEKKVKTNFGKFVNPYIHRSNGGIPIFSQERIQERAKKKEEQLHGGSQEAERRDFLVKYAAEEPQNLAPVIAVTDDTEMNFVTAQRRMAYYMFANKTYPNWGTPNPGTRNKPPVPHSRHVVEMDSYKFDYLMGDGYGFTIRIPGRKPPRTRAHDGFERFGKQPLQTFEEARSRPRKKQVSPAYAFDLADEHMNFPDVTQSLYTTHHGRYYGNDFEGELDDVSRASVERSPVKQVEFRRAKTRSFESDLLEHKRRNFARSRSERVMRTISDDIEEVTLQSAGDRPRNERPMFEPSAPIPSYSHISSPLANRKQR